MAQNQTVESRLSALEEAVAQIRSKLAPHEAEDDARWLERSSGSMKEFPEFDEVLRLGRAAREAARPAQESPA